MFLGLHTKCSVATRAGSQGLVAAGCGEVQGAAEAGSAPERAAGLRQRRRGGACPGAGGGRLRMAAGEGAKLLHFAKGLFTLSLSNKENQS